MMGTKRRSSTVTVVFAILCCMLGIITCQTFNDSSTLTNNLLNGYNKFVRPVQNQADAVDVSVGFYLLYIPDFDEISETLTTVASLVVIWNDCNMQWNPSDYSNVPSVTVSYKKVWIPDLIVINPTDGMDSLANDWHLVRYYADGLAAWVPGGILKTSCSVDVRNYPFDKQKCSVSVYPWGYDIGELTLTLPQQDAVNKEYYNENGAWALDEIEANIRNLGTMNETVFTLHLRRKPTFVLVNVVVPILALSLLNLLVFILPVESGERVSYSITVLLSIAVFMTIVSEELPKNSEPMAIIALVLMLQLVLSGLIMSITICNLRLYYKDESKRVPNILRRCVGLLNGNCNRRRVLPVYDKEKEATTGNDLQRQDPISEDVTRKKRFLGRLDDGLGGETNAASPVTWKAVSHFVDMLCLILFLLVNVLTYIVYFVLALSD